MCYGWFLLLRKFNPESAYSLLYLGGILSAETAEGNATQRKCMRNFDALRFSFCIASVFPPR